MKDEGKRIQAEFVCSLAIEYRKIEFGGAAQAGYEIPSQYMNISVCYLQISFCKSLAGAIIQHLKSADS